MRPSQIQFIKLILKMTLISLGLLFIMYHPIMFILMFTTIIIIGVILIKVLPNILEYIEDLK